MLAGSLDAAGTRRGGFIEIASWFEPIALADELSIEARAGEGSAYTIEWADDATGFAARLAIGERPGISGRTGSWSRRWYALLDVRVRLLKRTPVGGGLGGDRPTPRR